MKKFVTSALLVVATLGLLALLWQFRDALILFVFSLAVAAMMRPATDYWAARGVPRGLALVLTYVIGLALLGGILFLISRPLVAELTRATDRFAQLYQQALDTWPKGTPFQQTVAARMPPLVDLYQAIAGEQGTALLSGVVGLAQGFLAYVGQILIVVILSIYWSADRVHFERLLLSLVPVRSRNRARAVWGSIELGVGAYMRSEFIQSVLAGLLLGAGYWLMGLPYPVILALSGALLWLIPWLGAVLAMALPIMVGWGQSPAMAAAAATYTVIVLLVLEIVVEPRIFNRRRYSSLLIILFVVALSDAFGLFGLIIAPPLAAAIQILFRNLISATPTPEPVRPGVQLANIKTRLEGVEALLASQPEPVPPEIGSLVARLETLLAESEEFLQEEDEKPSLDLPLAVSSR